MAKQESDGGVEIDAKQTDASMFAPWMSRVNGSNVL
jgi:hypothetical protein